MTPSSLLRAPGVMILVTRQRRFPQLGTGASQRRLGVFAKPEEAGEVTHSRNAAAPRQRVVEALSYEIAARHPSAD